MNINKYTEKAREAVASAIELAREHNNPQLEPEHLLVALDGSPHAERVLEHTEALAKAFGSTITLLRATVSAETLLAETAGSGQSLGDVSPVLDPTPILEAELGAEQKAIDADRKAAS